MSGAEYNTIVFVVVVVVIVMGSYVTQTILESLVEPRMTRIPPWSSLLI